VAASCVFLVLATSLNAFGAQDPPPTTAADDQSSVKCNRLGCGPNAYDPGSAGTPSVNVGTGTGTSNTDTSFNSGTEGTADGAASAPDPCPWMVVDDLGANSSWWGGNDPSTGHVELNYCATGPPSLGGSPTAVTRFVPNAAPGAPAPPVAPPPPTPEELAQQAYKQLPIPDPSMNFGPDDTKIAVRYWLYLWLDDPGPVTATATAGAVSVTAIARLSSVTWTMGEPVSADNLYTPAAPITCQGPGLNPGPGVDTATPEPLAGTCSYMFEVRSTPERTGGTGAWPVTATATWTITWAANTGQSGTLQAPPRVSTTQVSVGAWSTVMVADGESVPGG